MEVVVIVQCAGTEAIVKGECQTISELLVMDDCATTAGSSNERAVLAAQQAISSPLLDSATISGAQGVLVNITGDENMTLHEVDEATSIIFEEAGKDANIIFGAVLDPNMNGEIQVTVIATGFNQIQQVKEIEETSKYPEFPNKRSRELMNHKNETLVQQKENPKLGGDEISSHGKSKFHFELLFVR